MNGELLTIKDVAQRAGVSTQAIYQRLDKDLKTYLQVKEGKKYLKAEALELFNKAPLQPPLQEVDKDLQSGLQAMVDTLREQLAQKDKQIETLQSELREQNAHVRAQSEKLVLLVEQVNELQRNNQVLLKAEQDRNKAKELPEASSVPPVLNTEEAKDAPPPGTVTGESEQQRSGGFLEWLRRVFFE